jgi:general secretion pathway protein G
MIATVMPPPASRESEEINATKAQLATVKSAVELYRATININKYPERLRDLTEKPTTVEAKDWAGPYLSRRGVPEDAWGNTFRYAVPGKHNPQSFDVWSPGPDGRDGTADDIGNWRTEETRTERTNISPGPDE